MSENQPSDLNQQILDELTQIRKKVSNLYTLIVALVVLSLVGGCIATIGGF
jgi:hypothetical protein